ncbi:MAG: efflux RND transporter permease subunit [Pseudomonadales bacterium]|nr:efflux RND transporter permease subunit [Pseudomonadales bacterium]
MNAFIEAAINRTRTTLLALVMIVIAGVFARGAMPIENDPHIQVPFFVVTLIHEGISPEDAERLLVMPMEVEIRAVEGLEEMTAYAYEGGAALMVEFDADYNLERALSDVREAVDRAKPKLPSDTEEPIINEESTDDFPILQVNLVSEGLPERLVYNLAIDLRDRIRAIPDVREVELSGHREEMLEAVIDPQALESYQISGEELITTIMRNNRLIPAGSMDTGNGRFSVKVPSLIEEARDLFDLPIRAKDGNVVTVRDVATVHRTFKDRSTYARVNGKDAITLRVEKRAQANIIDTVHAAKAVVEDFRTTMPSAVEVFYTQDQAPFAENQVNELQGNIFTALALVMVVVVGAIGFRSGVIVGLGIPVSFLFSIIFIYSLGYTFNFMVMFGLLLGLGMLIDGAIVVTEYADRKMVEGYSPRSAYTLAAKRMFWPVTASVATTLAAFLPLMFWPGISGKFMRYLPVTVFTVLSGSLLYALVFGPVLGALFGKASARDEKAQRTLQELEDGDPRLLSSFTGIYARFLSGATRNAVVTLGIALLAMFLCFWAYGNYGKGMMFMSDSEPHFGIVTVRARGNLSAQEIDRLVRDVDARIAEIDGVQSANTQTMIQGGPSRSGFDRIGSIFVELHEQRYLKRTGSEIFEEIRQRTSDLAGISVEIQEMEQGPPTGKPVQIEFASYTRSLLEPAVTRVVDYLKENVPQVRDIDDTRSLPGLEWELTVDRAQAAIYGADVTQVGLAVQLVTNGVLVGKYRPDKSDDDVDIRVRYPSEYRGVNALDDLRIMTRQGMVPISNFVTRKPAPNVDTTQRIDGVPVEFVRANVAADVLADDVVKQIEAWVKSQEWDPRLNIRFRGANEEQAEAMAFVGVAFLLSLLLMFALLVTQFNSLYQATLILFAVVFSTAGVLLWLLISQQPFSAIMTGIGIVALAGIVVNNNIILIDAYNHLRKEHPELDYVSLIVRTGAQRLRPVMLTTITTVFGLLPLASNISIDLVSREIVVGSQMSMFWVPLSQAIVAGLAVSTLLTLVTTPAMLALPHQLRGLWQRRAGKSPAPATTTASRGTFATD